jgi:hypothetical protein
MQIHYCYTSTPVGDLMLVGDATGLKYINFQQGPEPMLPESEWRKDAA